MIKPSAINRNSIITGVLLNLIMLMIFIVFIILGYKSTTQNAAIQDDTFRTHFQSRLILKSINGVNHSRADILMALKEKDKDLIDQAEDNILGAKSNYNLLISEQVVNKGRVSDGFHSSFNELTDLFEVVLKDELPFENKNELNKILIKTNDLIEKMHTEESTLWVDEALKLHEFSKVKERNLHVFYGLTICFILLQILLIYFTIIKYQLNKKINIQQERLVLQTRLSTLGMMSAELAHEINSPLMVIDGRLRILQKEMQTKESGNEKIISNLEIIKRNSMRIQGIIKSFKTMSKSGENDELEAIYLVSIYDDVNDLIEQKLKDESVEYTLQEVDSEIFIKARRIQIVQVLTNLINNSIDAIKGTQGPWLKLETLVEKDRIVITVTDSGSGIAQEHINQIFDPFYSTKGSVAGTGLGLSISKKIMKEHGGDLIYNPNSKNTQFVLTFKNEKAHS